MNKEKRVQIFDQNALDYERYRPGYPSAIIDKLIDISRLHASDHTLEIGCGTGQLTTEFLERGYPVTAIEKGLSLAQITQAKANTIGIGKVIYTAFEDWTPQDTFSLVVSAQAFHWIEKASGISKITALLKEKGSIGLIWNIDQSEHTEFWQRTQTLYQRYLPALAQAKSIQETVSEHWTYVNQQKTLTDFQLIEHSWEKTYTKEAYLGLLRTFSPHMSLQPKTRAGFFQEIGTIIEDCHNKVTRSYKTVLLFARKA